MKKQILQFPSLQLLCAFMKELNCGYLINTNSLTLTAGLSAQLLFIAERKYQGLLLELRDGGSTY